MNMAKENMDHPFHFDPRGRTAETGDDEHVRDMIEQLLFTSPGERTDFALTPLT